MRTSQVCPPGERCVNTMGSFECASQCELGLRLDPASDRCQDVDECSASSSPACFGGRRCVNTVGSYRCECPEGYAEDQATGRCKDVDECADARWEPLKWSK